MNVRFINCTGFYVQFECIPFSIIEKRTLLRGCSSSLYRAFYNAFMSKDGYLNTI